MKSHKNRRACRFAVLLWFKFFFFVGVWWWFGRTRT